MSTEPIICPYCGTSEKAPEVHREVTAEWDAARQEGGQHAHPTLRDRYQGTGEAMRRRQDCPHATEHPENQPPAAAPVVAASPPEAPKPRKPRKRKPRAAPREPAGEGWKPVVDAMHEARTEQEEGDGDGKLSGVQAARQDVPGLREGDGEGKREEEVPAPEAKGAHGVLKPSRRQRGGDW